ncbi:MAG: tetratricopeptide repeat protein [Candidatus Latescibacterota bacterium]|nr:MAG: tetratricopeptide repeat protein [Candidatus Latescibacterota bacterium]
MIKPKRERRPTQRDRSRPQKRATRRGQTIVRREWIVLGIILLVGLLLRIGYLAEIKTSPAFEYPAFDAAFHDHWARCLVSGNWSAPQFHNDPLIHEMPFFRPPGYPYFLAAVYKTTGKSYVAARIIQMLIGLAGCALVYLLGRSLFGSRTGLIAAALMSVYWIFIYFEGELLAPVLLVLFAPAVMLVLARWLDGVTHVNAITAGLMVGLFALVRPNALVLAPIALVWVWWVARRRGESKRWRIALIGFPLGVLIAIAPATIRNYRVSGDFVPITSNAGVNFYIGNNEHTDCVSANVPVLERITSLGSWTCFDQPAIVAAVEKTVGRPLKSSEVSAFFNQKARDHIAAYPGKTLGFMWRKTLLFWGPTEISNNKVIHYERAHSRILKRLPGFPLAFALAIAGLAVFVHGRRRIRNTGGSALPAPGFQLELIVLIVAFILAYFASYLPFFVAGRYRVPIIPFLLLFGAYGIDWLWTTLSRRELKKAGIWIGALVLLFFATSRQLAAYEPDLGMWHFDRGDAWRKQGNTQRAREEFRLAIERATNPTPVACNNLGVALDQMGQSAEAAKYFQQALDIKPTFLEARRNLVSVLLRTNQIAAAATHLQKIIRIEPGDARARFNLGVCLLRLDRGDEAIEQLTESVRLNPNHFFAQFYLARALKLAGRPDEALVRYTAAVKLEPGQIEARYELATLLAESGREADAADHLTRILNQKPDHEEAKRLLDDLQSK